MMQLHLRHYIYIFFALSSLLFAIFVLSINNSLNNLDSDIHQNSLHAANAEIDSAIANLKLRIDTLAKDISDWDEVHQQLRNPNYYDYWKAQRLHGAKLPLYLAALEIYDEHKIALSDTDDAALPTSFISADAYFYYLGNKIYYVRLYPIHSRTQMSKVTGYIGLKVDLVYSLLNTSRFVFIDVSSLSVRGGEEVQIIVDGISKYLDYQPVKNPAFDDMRKLVYSSLQFGALMAIVFFTALYAMFRFIISRPISELNDYVDNLKLGNPSCMPLKNLPIVELDNLRKSLDVYQNELESAYRSLDIKNDELWQLAHHDPLTGIANRRAFDKDWKSHLAIAADKRVNISLMLIDCDHFKAINDTYGHDIGDRLIKRLSKILQISIREGDRLYRIGGDEFVTILWDTDQLTAEAIATRCLKNIRNQRYEDLGIKEPISISIGISHKNAGQDTTLEELPRQADIAMYHAKKSGNRNIVHYESFLEKDVAPLVSNRILDSVLKAAETGQGITMHYQPVVNSKTGKIDYFEALIRIVDNHGIITPNEIFPVVERLSLEAEIDIAIINCINDDLARHLLPPHTGVSVNLSSTTLTLPNLADILGQLSKHISHHKCILEVTETTLITNINSASLKLSELRKLGFKIALDDFGSGYSSIRYLASMPIDIVKFDISMIRQLAMEGAASVISGTAQVILKSGYKLVAEGIETEDVRQLVISMGATHLQGYLLGKPVPLGQLSSVASVN